MGGKGQGRALAALILALALPALAARAGARPDGKLERPEETILLTCQAGYDGLFRPGAWNPLRVTVQNNGAEALEGQLVFSQSGRDERLASLALVLPPGARKRFAFSLPLADGSLALWLEDRRGRLLAREEAQPLAMSEDEPLAALLDPAPHRGKLPRVETGGESARFHAPRLNFARLPRNELPADWTGYAGLDLLLVGDPGALDPPLDEPEQEALRRWLRAGGVLVVWPGAAWEEERARFWRSLFPAGAVGQTVPEGGFAQGLGLVEEGPAEGRRLQEAGGRTALRGSDGSPILVGFPRGAGAAYLCAWPVTRRPSFLAGQSPAVVALLAAAGKSLDAEDDWRQRQFFGQKKLGRAFEASATCSLDPLWLALFALAYAAVVGPLDYLLVRRLKRPLLTWLTFAVFAALFSAYAGWRGVAVRGGASRFLECTVSDLLPGEPLAEQRGGGFFFSSRHQTVPVAAEGFGLLQGPGSLRLDPAGRFPELDLPVAIYTTRSFFGRRLAEPPWQAESRLGWDGERPAGTIRLLPAGRLEPLGLLCALPGIETQTPGGAWSQHLRFFRLQPGAQPGEFTVGGEDQRFLESLRWEAQLPDSSRERRPPFLPAARVLLLDSCCPQAGPDQERGEVLLRELDLWPALRAGGMAIICEARSAWPFLSLAGRRASERLDLVRVLVSPEG